MRRQERGKNADQRDQEDESHRHHSGTVVQKAFSHGSALLSQSGVGHGLKDVEHQIEYHEQYADEQHISLDDRQITIEDGTDAQRPQPRPGKHVLHTMVPAIIWGWLIPMATMQVCMEFLSTCFTQMERWGRPRTLA